MFILIDFGVVVVVCLQKAIAYVLIVEILSNTVSWLKTIYWLILYTYLGLLLYDMIEWTFQFNHSNDNLWYYMGGIFSIKRLVSVRGAVQRKRKSQCLASLVKGMHCFKTSLYQSFQYMVSGTHNRWNIMYCLLD